MMRNPIIICADDFALNSGVSTAIAQLAEQGHISATSAMSLSPHWPEHAQWLKPLSQHIDVGLHLDWTSPFAASAGHGCKLSTLMRHSLTGNIDKKQAQAVIEAQLDLFEAYWGTAPSHVDGHQHIHQFPIIRDALIQSMTARYPTESRPWLRISRPLKPGMDIKSWVIWGMGAHALQRQAQQAGVPHSTWLTGIYGFSGDHSDYETRMNAWLAQVHRKQCVVLMCHPGQDVDDNRDEIGAARNVEFGFLSSAAFTTMLGKNRLYPAQGQQTINTAMKACVRL